LAVTLRDIAKHVNLSHATVSFVLNNRRDVAIPETTRIRVKAAAKELGYHPNRAARALVMGRTRVIGVWTPPLTSHYVQSIFQGITDTFRTAGFDSLYCRHSPEYATRPFEWPVDGIIYVEGDAAKAEEVLPEGVPVVQIGSRLTEGLDQINVDIAAGASEAIRHLLEGGRSNIVCIAREPISIDSTIIRTYNNSIASANKSPLSLILPISTQGEMLIFVTEFLRTHPKTDAILCTSLEITRVVRRALADLALRIPADVAIVGFDYSDDLEFETPSITAIEIPTDRIVELATEMLLARMADANLPPRKETVATNLRILESTRSTARKVAEGVSTY